MNRIFIGIVAFILLMVTLVAILSSGGSKKPAKTANGITLRLLPDYANTDATVSMEIDGRVNGDESHRAVRVTIGRDQRDFQVIQGYSGRVIESKTFYNTQPAYDVFLRAIRGGGFMSKLKNTKYSDDRGVCPLGDRYIFTLSENGDDLSRLWGSTCGTKVGTLGGSRSLLQQLFQAQIPDYNKLTAQTVL